MSADWRGPAFLDITRLVTRVDGGPLSGIDRVERAWLKALVDRGVPHHLCSRTTLGWLVVGNQSSQRVLDWIDRPASLPTPGLLARLVANPRRTPALEAALRGMAAARLRATGLAEWLADAGKGGGWWLSVGHMNLNEATLGAARRGGLRVAAMIHDTIPIDHPEWSGKGAPRRLAGQIAAAARHADLLLTPSQAAARDLTRHLPPGSASRILPAPLGIEVKVAEPSLLPAGFDPERTNFVALGTIEPRKNLALLLDIWDGFQRKGTHPPILHVIGRHGWACEGVMTRLAGHDTISAPVFHHANLSDGAVAALLDHATALLAPSRAEGFGLPPAEAALRGLPVVATDLPVTREVLGDYPTYLAADDVAGWSAAIRGLAAAPEKRTPVRLADWTAYFNSVFNHF